MASVNVEDIPIVHRLLNDPNTPPQDTTAENQWHSLASNLTPLNLKDLEAPLTKLDAHLTLRSYISGYDLSRSDLLLWGTLRNNRIAHSYIKQGLRVSLSRWFNFIEASNAWIPAAVSEASATASKTPGSTAGDTNKRTTDEQDPYDIGLQDTSNGVVTRFPPEPSGYLHIGHAKAALLNDYFAHKKYPGGTLILRFDDTNPAKETQAFEDAIIEDLTLLGITPDKTTHTSDYFAQLHDYCVAMLESGHAYADDTPQDLLREERKAGIPSRNRDAPIPTNLTHFASMRAGTPEGQKWYIRAKISPDDPNGALRDPVLYRCSPLPHHRTGTTWKIYPTYDFCCPVVDALEGVTHALRTTEYNDRDAQYQWVLRSLNLRTVHNWNFSRMSFIRTLLSKRKLTQFVTNGTVRGWDDPRMPTVRGIRRRGCTIPALHEFILKQGPSKNIVNLDWTAFWATNKKYIDPISARYTAIAQRDAVSTSVRGARAGVHTEQVALHAKFDLGTKAVVYSGDILLEQADAASLVEDEEITLMNWGNAIVRSITHKTFNLSRTVSHVELDLHLQGSVKSTAKKLTWLSSDQELTPIELVDYDYLISKDKIEEGERVEDFLNPVTERKEVCWADLNVARLGQDAVGQFDRKGYFRVDRPFRHGESAVLFQIPTGKTK
ncbi:MAG: hypothetical protein M1828_002080 [Chrysothrix sp. TS-e1954]|nr:MAG: hypothetical protein M1828_002080 [Chrysothrix sp. TS-e1954]